MLLLAGLADDIGLQPARENLIDDTIAPVDTVLLRLNWLLLIGTPTKKKMKEITLKWAKSKTVASVFLPPAVSMEYV